MALRGCDAESKPDFSAAAAAGGVSSIAVSPPGGTPLPPYSSSTHLIKAMELEFAEATGKPVQRGNWGGKLEFILTCVGYAVGLGNVWRFPYLCYKNGGGAFLIPYVVMLALVGLPLFFMELAFGQFASLGPITAWKVSPAFKGLGYSMVLVDLLVALYYNVVIAWCVYYFFASMTAHLPWASCDHSWNTPACLLNAAHNSTWSNGTKATEGLVTEFKSPSEEFFYNRVLNMTDGIEDLGGLNWRLAACLGVAWVIVFLVLIKGVSSLGKVVYFSSTFPYVLLTVMLIRGVTLPGAMDGILYYVKPDFSRLTDAQVWSDAAVQIFYSLSTCSGGLIAMASYNKFNNNCLRDSFLVPLINCGTSIFAGFVIFSVLGFMAHEKGVDVKDVAASGPGLVFVVYPEGLSQMPLSPLWSVLFFFMLLNLGFSSEFSMVECVLASLTDEFSSVIRKTRTRTYVFRFVCCALFCCCGLPFVTNGGFYVVNMVDTYVGGFPLLFIGLFECVVLQYVYGYKRFAEDIRMMLGRSPMFFFKLTWCFVSPILLFTIIVFKALQYSPLTLFGSYTYPAWAMGVAWGIAAVSLAGIPLWFVGQALHDGGWQVMKRATQPSSSWGPADPADRTGRYAITAPRDLELAAPRVTLPRARLHLAPQHAAQSEEGYFENEGFTDSYPSETL